MKSVVESTGNSRASIDAVVTTFTLAFPASLCSLVLIERKAGIMFARGPFLLTERLTWWEVAFFIVIYCSEILALQLSASQIVAFLFKSFLTKHSFMRHALFNMIALCYLPLVLIHFQALRYFKDGIDLALMRTLSGDKLPDALRYIQNELVGLLPLALTTAGLLVAGAVTLAYYQAVLGRWLSASPILSGLSSYRFTLIVNVLLVFLPLVLVLEAPKLDIALRYSLAHYVYSVPATYLTDFDGDGYGMMRRPIDFAQFDRTRHPYAVDIPGNGIDEDGIGGDLPAIEWDRTPKPWDPEELDRPNVLLIVLESARYDLLADRVNGVPAMPSLQALPGEPVLMFSHSGVSSSSITAILNGTVAIGEEGISLIDRFHALGYHTGVFSGQHEGFGNIASLTHMQHADVFEDATRFPAAARMYSGSVDASLEIPAHMVNEKLMTWLRSVSTGRPFFAYVNYQEMHFPYYYYGEPTPMVTHPLPRPDIVPERKAELRLTYLNAARQADDAIAAVISLLRDLKVFDHTITLVTGDHGEELFDNGYLGHGINLSYEQNGTIGKLINSKWKPPRVPVGQNEITDLLFNSMIHAPDDLITLDPEVLCYMGSARKPHQIGLFTEAGLVRYDFNKDLWSRQPRPGEAFQRSALVNHLIYKWESYVIAGLKAH